MTKTTTISIKTLLEVMEIAGSCKRCGAVPLAVKTDLDKLRLFHHCSTTGEKFDSVGTIAEIQRDWLRENRKALH